MRKKFPFSLRPWHETYDWHEQHGCFVAAAVVVGAATVASAATGAVEAGNAASTEASAATNAAQASLMATQETNALNYEIYTQNQQNLSPFTQVQGEAEAALASGFGLGTPNTGANQTANQGNQGGTPGYGPNAPVTNPLNNLGGTSTTGGQPPMSQAQSYSPWRGGTVNPTSTVQAAPGAIVSAPGGASNLSLGTGAQTPNAVYGQNQNTGGAPTTGSSAVTANIPGIGNVSTQNYGANQGQLNAGAASQTSGGLLENFNNSDLQSQLNPSYNFILGQGEQSTANYDAAHGISGGQATRDQTTFAENTASTFYQQAFNNYNTQMQNNISNLSNLAGNGATQSANSAGTSAANSITSNTQTGVAAANNYNTQGASAIAAGDTATGNAINGAIGSATSAYLTNNLLSKYGTTN